MKHTKKLAMGSPLSLVAILLFLTLQSQAFGYSFTSDFKSGYYWNSFPIKMAKFVSLESDSGLLEKLTNEAVAEWENVIGKDIWELSAVEKTNSFSGNYIRWSDNFGEETGYDPSRTLAITIRYNQGTFFERTVIILNGNISYLRQNWGNSLKTTILHEIGHTLGLDHSEQTDAIMATSLGEAMTLQSDDVEGVNAIIDETVRRQSTGFVSPFAAKEEKVAACGSLEDISRNGQGPSNGLMNFLGSLAFGMLLIGLVKTFERRRRQIFLIRY